VGLKREREGGWNMSPPSPVIAQDEEDKMYPSRGCAVIPTQWAISLQRTRLTRAHGYNLKVSLQIFTPGSVVFAVI
jgi:hypothetical protein